MNTVKSVIFKKTNKGDNNGTNKEDRHVIK